MAKPRENRSGGPRRTWWLLAAALAPLVVLVVAQYRWLVSLERVSAVAHQATLDNYLEAIASGVELHYRSMGERALNLPAAIFTSGKEQKAAWYFEKKAGPGARRHFVVGFVGEAAGKVLFNVPGELRLEAPEWSDEVRAVHVAIAPWKVLAGKHGTVERPALQLDERDPDHRMILNPITDEAGKLVAIAGLIVDPVHFEQEVLPERVAAALPKFYRAGAADEPVVVLHTADGRSRSFGGPAPGRPEEAARSLGFPFRDASIGIHSRHRTAADWARRNFELNLALSLVLAGVVAGGVLFALRAASREMRLSQMKSDFVSNVSHELRTPLASIRVFGELLRLGRAESAEKVREYGELIETESRRLTQLIDNILDLARIESGRRTYELAAGDLERLVAEVLRTFRPRLAQEGFRLELVPSVEPLPPVAFDEAALARAIGNLVDNAVKYSGDSREVEVGVRREAGSAVVWVRDRGIGIPREEQERVFDRFHRVSTGLVHDVKGSGLGLAIVRHVVAAHGGTIELASRPGEGSTFSIRLPLEAGAAPARAAARDAHLSEA
jgi:two-component system phosphate regulon sensor histidine kinase PhoR